MNTSTEIPLYRLDAPFYAEDDTLYEEGTEFRYNGVPNEYMTPLNEPARLRLEAYLPSIDRKPLDVQLAEAKAREMAKPVAVIPQPAMGGHDRTAPLMPDPKLRPKAAASLVVDAKEPVAGVQRGAKKQFGSVIVERHGGADTGGGYSG